MQGLELIKHAFRVIIRDSGLFVEIQPLFMIIVYLTHTSVVAYFNTGVARIDTVVSKDHRAAPLHLTESNVKTYKQSAALNSNVFVSLEAIGLRPVSPPSSQSLNL